MRSSLIHWLVATVVSAVLLGGALFEAAHAQTAAGAWHGLIETPAGSLPLVLKITAGEGGKLQGELISPDQTDRPIPVAEIKQADGRLTFAAPSVGGTYEGQWDPATGGWKGQFSQLGRPLSLTLLPGDLPKRAPVTGLDGDWAGAIERNGASLRLVLHVVQGAYGTRALLDSPDQLIAGLPVSGLSHEGSAVGFEVKAVSGAYRGELGADGRIVGQWTQGAVSLPLTLVRRATPAVVRRPQTPKPPFPYRAEEVAFDSAPGVRLAGTLTLPPGKGPFPAAVLITGSGAQDRDETILGHKPFAVLADDLTRRGVAVLRYDDRGFAGSTGEFAKATTEDFAADAAAAVSFLRGRKDIDARRIGLIGHSEGGVVAPMVAARDSKVGFVVLMAGLGVSGRETLNAQRVAIGRAMGLDEAAAGRGAQQFDRMLVAMQGAKDEADARERARAVALAESKTGKLAPIEEQSIALLATDWYRRLMDYDPRPTLAKVRVPVLAVNGSKDLQVIPGQNLPAIKAALAADRDVTVIELPGLNHLFQTANTGAPGEYADIEETIAPLALRTIGDWVAAHTRR
jgi:fermentation-respiration switch protein FrsA (DUF1100 family)